MANPPPGGEGWPPLHGVAWPPLFYSASARREGATPGRVGMVPALFGRPGPGEAWPFSAPGRSGTKFPLYVAF